MVDYESPVHGPVEDWASAEDEIIKGFISSHFNELRSRFSGFRARVLHDELSFALRRQVARKLAIFANQRY
ncbi:hypothetical protein A6X21_22335 [Planctopirus hydrillae]|uniref:Uncharacterized protein n=1 Tax=Planctopirus hydrillae TaxID=1841610 RepID=A0A1C3EDU6_9PLAN|nr:hypothetical protein A6X21_22335 [Planctopirus hydrillae]